MIGDFSSFIELCAAAYFTMCLDSEKFKQFWNPDRKVFVNNISLQDSIDESINTTRDNEILALRRMGVFMIVICFLLLVLVGFERKMSADSNRLAVAIIFSYGIIFILEVIHNAFFKLMKFVVISLACTLFIFLVLWFWNGLNASLQSNFINSLYENIDLLTTFILLFPLVVHIIRLWLRSSVHRGYLRAKVAQETKEYQKAIQAITIGKPSGVSKKYLAAWDNVKNPKDPDPDTTPFTNLYVKSIVKELYPNDIILIWSFVAHWVMKIRNWMTGLFRKN